MICQGLAFLKHPKFYVKTQVTIDDDIFLLFLSPVVTVVSSSHCTGHCHDRACDLVLKSGSVEFKRYRRHPVASRSLA